MTDTRDAADAVRLAAIRARSPEARLRDAIALSEAMHGVIMARLRARFPDRSVVELALMAGAPNTGGSAPP